MNACHVLLSVLIIDFLLVFLAGIVRARMSLAETFTGAHRTDQAAVQYDKCLELLPAWSTCDNQTKVRI